MNGQEDILSAFVKAVVAGTVLLHDDLQNLVSQEELLHTISSSRLFTEVMVDDLIKEKLIVPVDEDREGMFHAAITLDFLNFNNKLVILGFPLRVRQKIAEMYYPLFWALCSDIEYEVMRYEEEVSREPSHHELSYVRVINERAVANNMERTEARILRFEPEGNHELRQLLAEMARKRGTLKKRAGFGFQENEIERTVKEIWLPPYRYFQGREIKAFIDIKSLEWTHEETSLLWGGHFDFALCDSNTVLQLVVEYNGTGHYGRSDRQKQQVQSRDEIKRRICEKVGVPIFTLTPEFSSVKQYREILKILLFIFRMSPNVADPQFLYDYATKLLYTLGREQSKTSTLDVVKFSEVASRLDVFRAKGRGDMLLALLWEVHLALGDMTELASILNSVRSKIGPRDIV